MADKAFSAGINDYKTIGDLRGCVNDTKSIRRLLMEEFGFSDNQIRVKTDHQVTKSELNKGWNWLLKDAKPGDRLVFHFAGHGSQTTDRDDDEEDGVDELLCLYGMDWHDPKTYLLDDELRVWTTQIPEGVAVTFVLDCCHSGTGTRMIEPNLSRAAETNYRSAASLSIDDVAERRAGTTRSVGAEHGVRPAAARDIDETTVLARYAPPPPEVQLAIDKAKRKSTMRGALKATRSRSGDDDGMNHVLWSGCRANQTSADAHINGDNHGAFTYYFCDAVRKEGTGNSAQVARRLKESLSNGNFSQVPQLEPSGTDGAVFGPGSDTSRPIGGGTKSDEDASGSVIPTASEWRSLLESLQQIASSLSSGGRAGVVGAPSGGRSLVYVHGICQHDPGYSDDWWASMSPHLSPAVGQMLGNDRHEVLWSEHVSQIDRAVAESADPAEQQRVTMLLQEILQERMTREVDEEIVARGQVVGRGDTAGPSAVRSLQPEGPVPRAALGIPGLNCIDDFVKYLTIDSVRRSVIAEFTDVLRPLLRRGDSVELISHSWGTVVAYEALRSLERTGFAGRVHNWFTVGAALAISYVARQLRPSDGQKPTLVDNWINVDARGDAVGGSVQATGMQVDQEYLRLKPVGCNEFLGFVSPACAHSSYFHAANTVVNRDIFGEWIERS